jgi:hypothetical protein
VKLPAPERINQFSWLSIPWLREVEEAAFVDAILENWDNCWGVDPRVDPEAMKRIRNAAAVLRYRLSSGEEWFDVPILMIADTTPQDMRFYYQKDYLRLQNAALSVPAKMVAVQEELALRLHHPHSYLPAYHKALLEKHAKVIGLAVHTDEWIASLRRECAEPVEIARVLAHFTLVALMLEATGIDGMCERAMQEAVEEVKTREGTSEDMTYNIEPYKPTIAARIQNERAYEIATPPYGLTEQGRSVSREARARAAATAASAQLAHQAALLGNELADRIHDNIAETLQSMVDREKDIQDPDVRNMMHKVTELFGAQAIRHNVAYFDAYGQQSARQTARELSPPPPRTWRDRVFGNGNQ